MQSFKKIYFIFIFVFIFQGCLSVKSKYYIERVSNEFDEYKIHRMFRNMLKNEETFYGEFVELNLQQFKKGKDFANYSIILVYRGEKYINIKQGESLVLLIDDERIPLKTLESKDATFGGRKQFREGIWEEEWYSIAPELLQKIAYAKEIKVKISGEKRSLVCSFTKDNFEGFQKFYETYVK